MDYEAQDEMFLAKILVPEGTEGITVGQPIMVTCEEEGDVSAFADFKLDANHAVAASAPKAPEELPPKKEEVPVDPSSGSPVAPGDFLVTSQTTQKVVPGPEIPKPVKAAPQAPQPAAPKATLPTAVPSAGGSLNGEKWGFGIKKSPISSRLVDDNDQ